MGRKRNKFSVLMKSSVPPRHPVIFFSVSEGGVSELLSFSRKSRFTYEVYIFRRLGLRVTTKCADQSEPIQTLKKVP